MNNTIPFEDLNSNVDGKNEMRDFETSIALNLISLINSKSDVYWSLQLAEMSYNRDFLYAYETKRYKTDKPPRIHSEAFTDDGFKYFSFESIGPLKRLGMFSALAIPCKYDREKYETVFNTTNCESILDKCRRKAIEYADPYNIKAHDRGDPLSWYRTIDVHGLLNRQVEAGLLKQKPENFNYMVNGKDYIVISDSVQNDINFYCLLPEYFQTIKGFENSIMKDPNTRGSHRDHKLYLDTVLAGMGIIVKRGDENNSIIHDEYADKLFREAIAKAVFAIFCRNYTVGECKHGCKKIGTLLKIEKPTSEENKKSSKGPSTKKRKLFGESDIMSVAFRDNSAQFINIDNQSKPIEPYFPYSQPQYLFTTTHDSRKYLDRIVSPYPTEPLVAESIALSSAEIN